MKTDVDFWVLRHAPTYWNKEHRMQGNQDTEIIPEGLDGYLNRILGEISIPKPDIIVTSGLKRTKQTAAGLVKKLGWLGVSVEQDARFNERSWGIFEGKTRDEVLSIMLSNEEIVEKFPQLKTTDNPSLIWDHDEFRYPTVETVHQLRFRVSKGVRILAQKYAGKRVVLVSHAGVILSLGLDHQIINHVLIDQRGEVRTYA